MLFTSPSFLFLFLPVVLCGTFLVRRLFSRTAALLWLATASIVFYGWDNPKRLVPLLLGSILFNYAMGVAIVRSRHRAFLWIGVAGNLLLLGVFKYAGFATTTLVVFGLPVPVAHVALPIGISFYTFTQISFLVDGYRGKDASLHPGEYLLFVTIFPHLIAGPILNHRDIVQQFRTRQAFRADFESLSRGLSWFTIGLFKKVVGADSVAPFADAVFDQAARGGALDGAQAWQGAMAYALQLYFDFSGYSDMAVGLALMMGLRFPLNFLSPYKARSLIDFWRRWHITLSMFLRENLYIPLGGNRLGERRRMINVFVTMALGGLWHGAGWTFVLWGALHGGGLCINHAWRRAGVRIDPRLGQAMTLLFVVAAWVPFRAATLSGATRLWAAMLHVGGSAPRAGWMWIAALSGVVLLAPNAAELFGRAERPASLRWRPSPATAVALGLGLGYAISLSISTPSAFLYFRF